MNFFSRARVPWGFINPKRPSSYSTAVSCSHHRKLDVQVGASLQLNMAHVDADVNVHTGDNMEQIEVKSLWKKVGSFSDAFTTITHQNNLICVDLQTIEAKQFLQKFEAVIPGRWCNLFLRSGKGHVTIQNMKEANVNIVTIGGNVTLGEVRGNEAFIESNGGSVRAALITAALDLRTSGGSLSLDKTIGTTIQVNSQAGDVKIGSAYGQDVNVTSGGGCISIKHLQAQEMALVSSNGGHVRIDGLDGNAVISTDGGNLHLQLLANAKEVVIKAATGEVALFMPAEDNLKFVVERVGGGENCAQKRLDPREQNSLTDGLTENSSTCRVRIAGSGKVTITRRSWLESVMQAPTAVRPA